MGIEAPTPAEQALLGKDFVDTRDAAMEAVGDVEHSGIGVGELAVDEHEAAQHFLVAGDGLLGFGEKLHGDLGPDRELAEEAADKADGYPAAVPVREQVGRQQVADDTVIVARVERNSIGTAGAGDAMQHIERAIAVEWGDLDARD